MKRLVGTTLAIVGIILAMNNPLSSQLDRSFQNCHIIDTLTIGGSIVMGLPKEEGITITKDSITWKQEGFEILEIKVKDGEIVLELLSYTGEIGENLILRTTRISPAKIMIAETHEDDVEGAKVAGIVIADDTSFIIGEERLRNLDR